MPILKTFFLLAIIIGLALVFIEQRLEAREFDKRVKILKGQISTLEMRKLELSMQLGREKSLAGVIPADSNSLPISADDIIVVNVERQAKTPARETPAPVFGLLGLDTPFR